MISNVRQQWLDAQYVDAIASDGQWYAEAHQWANVNEFRRFRTLTEAYIRKVASLVSADGLKPEERAYVILELWKNLEGFLECCLDSPGPYRPFFWEMLGKTEPKSMGYPEAKGEVLYIKFGDAYTMDRPKACRGMSIPFSGSDDHVINTMYEKGASLKQISQTLLVDPMKLVHHMVKMGILYMDKDSDFFHQSEEAPKPLRDTNPCNEILLEVEKHCSLANEHFARVADTLETIKEKHMTTAINTNPTVAIETRTIIFGRDASTLSEQDLIDAIKKVEGDIAKLKEVKTSSKKIAANIEALQTQLAAIVEVLDAR